MASQQDIPALGANLNFLLDTEPSALMSPDALTLHAAGHQVTSPLLGPGDWLRTRDGRIVVVETWPTIAQVGEWSPMEVRQRDGTVWRAPERARVTP